MSGSNGSNRGLVEAPKYLGRIERIEASRNYMDQVRKLELLVSLGFSCELERHVGFWLLHWAFPPLKLVPSGHVLRKKKG